MTSPVSQADAEGLTLVEMACELGVIKRCVLARTPTATAIVFAFELESGATFSVELGAASLGMLSRQAPNALADITN